MEENERTIDGDVSENIEFEDFSEELVDLPHVTKYIHKLEEHIKLQEKSILQLKEELVSNVCIEKNNLKCAFSFLIYYKCIIIPRKNHLRYQKKSLVTKNHKLISSRSMKPQSSRNGLSIKIKKIQLLLIKLRKLQSQQCYKQVLFMKKLPACIIIITLGITMTRLVYQIFTYTIQTAECTCDYN